MLSEKATTVRLLTTHWHTPPVLHTGLLVAWNRIFPLLLPYTCRMSPLPFPSSVWALDYIFIK